jgi:hypothetical protein
MKKRWRGRQTTLLAVTILAFLSTTPAYSDTIYSSFGPADSFATSSALVVGSYNEGPSNTPVATQWGFSFTPSFEATLDSIKFAAAYFGGNNALNAVLMTDSGGLPATALETFNFTGLSVAPTLYSASSTLHPVLSEATTYWIVLAPQGNGLFGWYEDDTLSGPLAARRDLLASDPNWQTVSALHPTYFAVEGTPVPIPAAAWLLGSGVVGLVVLRRRVKP